MFVLGVTGGIGSGKSTVASILRARGARILDADRIVHELYDGGELPRRLAERFGPAVLAPDGSIDRRALSERIFQSPAEKEALEAIVHPAVRKRVEGDLAALRAEGFGGLVVVEAALLVEGGEPLPLDALLLVSAAEETRLERLERRGMSREEAQRRMRAQVAGARKRPQADFVIANDGTAQELEEKVLAVLRELGRDEGGGSG